MVSGECRTVRQVAELPKLNVWGVIQRKKSPIDSATASGHPLEIVLPWGVAKLLRGGAWCAPSL